MGSFFIQNGAFVLQGLLFSTIIVSGAAEFPVTEVEEVKLEYAECPVGYWKAPGESENNCYKLFLDRRRTWPEAWSLCKADGGHQKAFLAEPKDPLALRNSILETFGHSWVWLGARGNGQAMAWMGGVLKGVELSNGSPYWWPGYPHNPYWSSSQYCLLMMADESHKEQYPTKPYAVFLCSTYYYALCQIGAKEV